MLKKYIRPIIWSTLGLLLFGIIVVLCLNLYVIKYSENYIVLPEQASTLTDIDCIMVLGCGVRGDKPTPLLADRLKRGVEVYNYGVAPKILMSGDHGKNDYDEVNVMKQYALDAGIAESNIFMDHAGFSTYESIYRAKAIFGVKSIVIVTQKYHLFRALYISDELGVDSVGVGADPRKYSGEAKRQIREVAARTKDMLWCAFKPEPTYLGETIDIHGSGDVTNDK